MGIREKIVNCCIVNGHAPTETSDDKEQDGIFDASERAYDIIPRVDNFICLDSLITGDNNVLEEITNHLTAPNSSYFGLKCHVKSQLLSSKTQILTYKELVRPLLKHTAECWSRTKNDDRRLSVFSIFNSKILHRIYVPRCEKGQWVKRYNREFNEQNIVNVIKSSMLRWVGHVAQMDEKELPKKYHAQTLEVKEDVADQNKGGLMGWMKTQGS